MHSEEEIAQKAAEFEAWADALDPDDPDVEIEDASDLRAIAEAADALASAETRAAEAVAIARAHGASWGRIGIALGVSRQAARQRYGSNSASTQ